MIAQDNSFWPKEDRMATNSNAPSYCSETEHGQLFEVQKIMVHDFRPVQWRKTSQIIDTSVRVIVSDMGRESTRAAI
jgi:hypothetical protein